MTRRNILIIQCLNHTFSSAVVRKVRVVKTGPLSIVFIRLLSLLTPIALALNTERAYKRSAVCTLLASFAPIMAGIGENNVNNGGFLQRSLSL